ncbi:MAG: hypothetical protein AAF928_19090 [Myxococcota bacterium]
MRTAWLGCALVWAAGCADEAIVAVEQGIVCDGPADLRLARDGGSGFESLVATTSGLRVFFAENQDLRAIDVSPALEVTSDTLPPLGRATFIEDLTGFETNDGVRVYFTRRGATRAVQTGVVGGAGRWEEVALFPDAPETQASISARAEDGTVAVAWWDQEIAATARLVDPVTVGRVAVAAEARTGPPLSLVAYAGSFFVLYRRRAGGVAWATYAEGGGALELRGEWPEIDLARLVAHREHLYVVAAEEAAVVVRRLDEHGRDGVEVGRLPTRVRPALLRVGTGDRSPLTLAWTEEGEPFVAFVSGAEEGDEVVSAAVRLPYEGEVVDLDARSLIRGGIVALEERDPDAAWLRRRCVP